MSWAWAQRRALYYATHPRACVAYGSDVDVILHHRHRLNRGLYVAPGSTKQGRMGGDGGRIVWAGLPRGAGADRQFDALLSDARSAVIALDRRRVGAPWA